MQQLNDERCKRLLLRQCKKKQKLETVVFKKLQHKQQKDYLKGQKNKTLKNLSSEIKTAKKNKKSLIGHFEDQ